MKRKLLAVCLVTILSLNVLGITSLAAKQVSINVIESKTTKIICATEKSEPCPVNIYSVRSKFI